MAENTNHVGASLTCSFCGKGEERVQMLMPGKTAGMYICDECALFCVLGPVMQLQQGSIALVLAGQKPRCIPAPESRVLGVSYCPACHAYNLKIHKQQKTECIRCGHTLQP